MPEIKHTFQAGKMNKDVDERLVPNGEYRDAMNIQVRTTAGDGDGVGDIGTAQNIQGNKKIGKAHEASGYQSLVNGESNDTKVIGSVADEKNNKAYFFHAGPSMAGVPVGSITTKKIFINTITEVDTGLGVVDPVLNPVVVDRYAIAEPASLVLGSPDGVNGILTPDNGYNQPYNQFYVLDPSEYHHGMTIKALDSDGNNLFRGAVIKNLQMGALGNIITLYNQQTADLNKCSAFIFERESVLKFNNDNHFITGINIIDDLLFWTDNLNEPRKINITRCKAGCNTSDAWKWSTHTNLMLEDKTSGDLVKFTDLEYIPSTDITSELKEEHITVIRKAPTTAPNLEMSNTNRPNYQPISNVLINFTNFSNPNSDDTPIGLSDDSPQQGDNITIENEAFNDIDYRINDILVFKEMSGGSPPIITATIDDINIGEYGVVSLTLTILSVTGSVISPNSETDGSGYWLITLQSSKPLFELKMGRFAYRYKYEDGEYSSFSPWSELAFLPGHFDYDHKKGYNLGMVNTLRELSIKDFIPYIRTRPDDVAEVDILYKTVNEPNVYVIKTIKRKKDFEWSLFSLSDINSNMVFGKLAITSEMIHKVLPSSQTLRAWDNVPRKALAQEIVGNRLVYSNYEQGYDIKNNVSLNQSIKSRAQAGVLNPKKSIKSLRKYKFGLVFGDRYGRETPVITPGYLDVTNPDDYITASNDVTIDKSLAHMNNSFEVTQSWESPDQSVAIPSEWMYYAKYYIKETSNEYYNLIMDRWYDAEDGNIWISFNSADRNKVDQDTYLVLKNEHGTQTPIQEKGRYKIIAIEADAPDDIKIDERVMGRVRLGSDSYESLGIADPAADNPSGLQEGKDVKIGIGDWNGFLDDHKQKSNAHLRMRVVGVLGGAEKKSQWVTVTHYKNKKEDASSGMARVWWNKQLGNDGDMHDKFTNSGYAAPLTGLKYYLEFKEDVIENKKEFDGKFFVKVQRDNTLEAKVLKFVTGEEDWDTTVSWNLAYIDSQPTNPAVNGPRSTYVWNDDAAVPADVDASSENIEGNNIATAINDFGFGSSGLHYANNSRWFGLGCDVQFGNVNPINFARQTKYFWYWFWLEAYQAHHTKLFVDGARGKKLNLGDHGDGDSGNVDEGDGVIKSATYYKPTAFDEGRANWSETGEFGPTANGEFGRLYVSISSSQGFANATSQSDMTGTWGSKGEAFKEYFSTIGNEFSFADDPESNIYRIIGGTFGETVETNADAGPYSGCNYNSAAYEQSINDTSIAAEEISDSSIYNIFAMEPLPISGTAEPGYCGPCGPNEVAVGWANNNSSICGDCFDDNVNMTLNILQNSIFGDSFCKRRSIRFEFRLVDKATGDLVDFGTRGINSSEWDPRGVVTHDGRESFRIQGVKKMKPDPTQYIPVANAAVFETEPKEDVGLDIYYEASSAIPMILSKENTTSFAPYGSKIGLKRWGTLSDGDGGEGFYNVTMSGIFNPHVFYIGYTASTSIIGIKSQPGIGLASTFHKKYISIGDYITFTHSDGLKTMSKVTRFMKPSFVDITPDMPANIEEVFEENQSQLVYIMQDPPNTPEYDESGVEIVSTQVKVVQEGGDTSADWISTLNLEIGDFIVPYGSSSIVPQGITITSVGTGSSFSNITLSSIDWLTTFSPIQVRIMKPTGFYEIDSSVYKYPVELSWFNCYSFGNGVESDRIRDDFNAPQIDNGAKVSTTFLDYGKENKGSGMIYSGLYNSTSGVNDLNEFNMAEKITKNLNPAYGSIQALKTRDTDIIVFTEDKVLRVLANKDALFNADGNPQLTATDRVLGTAMPFAGDYGISKNPESLAWDQYRLYFTDMQRGAVLRLSGDGLTPISNVGMQSWFRDNLEQSKSLLGTFDVVNSEYNVTLKYRTKDKPSTTVSFNEPGKGWVSFKSFIPDEGVSIGGRYFTGYDNSIFLHNSEDVDRNTFYDLYTDSSISVLFNDLPSVVKSFKAINYEGSQAQIIQFTSDIVSAPEEGGLGNVNIPSDNEYYNLSGKNGWWVDSFVTDSVESGKINEFKEKEGKWFNSIAGHRDYDTPSTKEFNTQGVGMILGIPTSSETQTFNVTITADMINDPND